MKWMDGSVGGLTCDQTKTPTHTQPQDGDAEGEGAASPWVIRIELDKDKVAAKRVQLEDLQRIIVDVFGQGTFQIIISDQNMPRQVRKGGVGCVG